MFAMTSFTWRQRLRYRFDNLMSRGTLALIGVLTIASAAVVVGMSALVYVTGIAPIREGDPPSGFVRLLWMSLMRTLDPGTMGGDTGSWPFLFSMLAVTLGGIFVVSILIGILSNGIESRLVELRKGRSQVIERGHGVLLGWSNQVYSLVAEFVEANEARPGSCIVILAEMDKVEMEDAIRAKLGSTGRTRVVCRKGNPTDPVDLEIVNPRDARAIIVLSDEGPGADFRVINTILALTNNPRRGEARYHIVAAMRDGRMVEAARMVGGDEVKIVVVGELVARMTAQTCRHRGLAAIYSEILDFGGNGIDFREAPALVGKTFREALFAYEDASVIGVRGPDGRIVLRPPSEQVLAPGDRLVAISETDEAERWTDRTDGEIDLEAIRDPVPHVRGPERTLILGWNRRGPVLLQELDTYVVPGSSVTIVTDQAEFGDFIVAIEAELENQEIVRRIADTRNRLALDALEIGSFDHVVILSDSDRLGMDDADAATLVTLLHLRDIRARTGGTFSIVSEMLDERHRELAAVTRADDFIASEKLVSLMLSQIAENAELTAVFDDLFVARGNTISFHPAAEYVVPETPVRFRTVVESARRRGEIAIGYRAVAGASAASPTSASSGSPTGVVVNPGKSETITFRETDRIAVITGS